MNLIPEQVNSSLQIRFPTNFRFLVHSTVDVFGERESDFPWKTQWLMNHVRGLSSKLICLSKTSDKSK